MQSIATWYYIIGETNHRSSRCGVPSHPTSSPDFERCSIHEADMMYTVLSLPFAKKYKMFNAYLGMLVPKPCMSLVVEGCDGQRLHYATICLDKETGISHRIKYK